MNISGPFGAGTGSGTGSGTTSSGRSQSSTRYTTSIPDEPNEQLGFELNPQDEYWTFTPEYYPDRFTQAKDRELKRDDRQCGGEDVSIDAIKNREFHVSGVVLAGEVPVLQRVMDYESEIDVISPLTPTGGMECVIKDSELGNIEGWDAMHRQWRFEYSLDLVSTGRDEHDRDRNVIISRIIG